MQSMSDDEKFPSNPSDYDFSNHFQEDVLEDESRHLDMKKALDTIRYGRRMDADGNAEKEFIREYHGVKVYILVGFNTKKEVPVVITGWPAVHDPRQAIMSGRWTEAQLRDIHDFNDGDSLESDFHYP